MHQWWNTVVDHHWYSSFFVCTNKVSGGHAWLVCVTKKSRTCLIAVDVMGSGWGRWSRDFVADVGKGCGLVWQGRLLIIPCACMVLRLVGPLVIFENDIAAYYFWKFWRLFRWWLTCLFVGGPQAISIVLLCDTGLCFGKQRACHLIGLCVLVVLVWVGCIS